MGGHSWRHDPVRASFDSLAGMTKQHADLRAQVEAFTTRLSRHPLLRLQRALAFLLGFAAGYQEALAQHLGFGSFELLQHQLWLEQGQETDTLIALETFQRHGLSLLD